MLSAAAQVFLPPHPLGVPSLLVQPVGPSLEAPKPPSQPLPWLVLISHSPPFATFLQH